MVDFKKAVQLLFPWSEDFITALHPVFPIKPYCINALPQPPTVKRHSVLWEIPSPFRLKFNLRSLGMGWQNHKHRA